MHRQSLGSPGSNHHHIHGGIMTVNSPLTSATETIPDSKRISFSGDDDEEKTKLLKSSHRSSSPPLPSKQKKSPEKMIHGIPILTLFCFLILYFSSHDPSQFEMDAFKGFKKRPETTLTVTGTRSVIGVEGEESAVAVRKRRDLREATEKRKMGVHRKMGDF